MTEQPTSTSVQDLKTRLDEIVDLVSDDSLDLDQALAYYEEAVKIGLQTSQILESDVALNNARYDEAQTDEQTEPEDVGTSPVGEVTPSNHLTQTEQGEQEQ